MGNQEKISYTTKTVRPPHIQIEWGNKGIMSEPAPLGETWKKEKGHTCGSHLGEKAD